MNASSEVISMWQDSWSHHSLAMEHNIKYSLFYENQHFWSTPFVYSPNDLTGASKAVPRVPSSDLSQRDLDPEKFWTASPNLVQFTYHLYLWIFFEEQQE